MIEVLKIILSIPTFPKLFVERYFTLVDCLKCLRNALILYTEIYFVIFPLAYLSTFILPHCVNYYWFITKIFWRLGNLMKWSGWLPGDNLEPSSVILPCSTEVQFKQLKMRYWSVLTLPEVAWTTLIKLREVPMLSMHWSLWCQGCNCQGCPDFSVDSLTPISSLCFRFLWSTTALFYYTLNYIDSFQFSTSVIVESSC